MSGFTAYNSPKEPDSTIDKNLGATAVQQVVKEIKDSGVMTKDCPPNTVMDVGWDYQVKLDGTKKDFHNPLPACRNTFDQIDNLLNSLVGKK
jgi:precorrin-4 methylase